MSTLIEGQVKQGKNWGRTDLTHFPADLVDHEALPRGGFALFSKSVYEDPINVITHTHAHMHAHAHTHTHTPVSYTHLTLPTTAEV